MVMFEEPRIIWEMSDKHSRIVKSLHKDDETVTIRYDMRNLSHSARGKAVLALAVKTAQQITGSTQHATEIEIYRVEYRPLFKNWRVYMRRVQLFNAAAILAGFPATPQTLWIDFVINGDNTVHSAVGSSTNYAKKGY